MWYQKSLFKQLIKPNNNEVVYLLLHFQFWHFQELYFQKCHFQIFSEMITYLDHFDTFGENFDFDTFKNDTFESV